MNNQIVASIVILGFASCSASAAIALEFEDIAAGTVYSYASLPVAVTSGGSSIALSPYAGSGSANARISGANFTGSTGNSLFLAANIRGEVVLPMPSGGGSFYYADQGGTNLLEINGETRDFDVLYTAGPGVLGGVNYSVSAITFAGRLVVLSGNINSIAFVGQEMSVDGVTLTLVPEPAAMAILATGVAMTLLKRRRR